MKLGKYSFKNKEEAQKRIDALGTAEDEDGNKYPTHKHSVAHLKYITLEEAVINEDGKLITESVLSEDYCVDVLWIGLEADKDGVYSHPYGWAGKAVDIDGNGVHGFSGLDYNSLKI
tara:strand:+ start:554 stop:904 length:351 start_codon:yes stop_codon:yes gene_type:complete